MIYLRSPKTKLLLSKLKVAKSKCRNILDDERLEACLRLANSLLHTYIADLERDTHQLFIDVFHPSKLDCQLKNSNISTGFMLTTAAAEVNLKFCSNKGLSLL